MMVIHPKMMTKSGHSKSNSKITCKWEVRASYFRNATRLCWVIWTFSKRSMEKVLHLACLRQRTHQVRLVLTGVQKLTKSNAQRDSTCRWGVVEWTSFATSIAQRLAIAAITSNSTISKYFHVTTVWAGSIQGARKLVASTWMRSKTFSATTARSGQKSMSLSSNLWLSKGLPVKFLFQLTLQMTLVFKSAGSDRFSLQTQSTLYPLTSCFWLQQYGRSKFSQSSIGRLQSMSSLSDNK